MHSRSRGHYYRPHRVYPLLVQRPRTTMCMCAPSTLAHARDVVPKIGPTTVNKKDLKELILSADPFFFASKGINRVLLVSLKSERRGAWKIFLPPSVKRFLTFRIKREQFQPFHRFIYSVIYSVGYRYTEQKSDFSV